MGPPPCPSTNSTHVSSLYTLVPSAVKSRIPRLPSLGRSVRPGSAPSSTPATDYFASPPNRPYTADFTSRGRGSVTDLYLHPHAGHSTELVTHDRYVTLTSNRSESPMPPLTVSSSLASSRPVTPSDEDIDSPRPLSGSPSSTGCTVQLHRSHTQLEPQVALRRRPAEGELGEFAAILPALTLLSTAHYTYSASPELSRPLVLDATTYLLRALPKDLSEREVESLREVLPVQLLQRVEDVAPKQTKPQQSSLRTFIATTLTQIFIAIALLLPYFKRVLETLYRMERRHHISERILVSCMGLVTVCEDKSVDLQYALGKFSQTRVGSQVVGSIGWTWDGLVGGFTDGFGQGVKILVRQTKATMSE